MDGTGLTADAHGAEHGAMQLRPIVDRLKPGPGLSADQVFAHQRRRLRVAVVEIVDEQGYEALTMRALTKSAGVSTRSFYSHFRSVDGYLGAVSAEVMDSALTRSTEGLRAELEWRPALSAAIEGLLVSLADDPQAARLALIEVYAAGPESRKRIGAAFSRLEEVLLAGFSLAPRSLLAPRHLIAGMAAGVFRIARKTALARRCDELPGLATAIVDWMATLPHAELLRLHPKTSAREKRREREAEPFPNDLTRASGRVEEDDRLRVLRAAAKLAAAEGLQSLTAPRIRAEAEVTRRRFDELFPDVGTCFTEAVAMTATVAVCRSQRWALQFDGWEKRTTKMVLGLAAQVARDRDLSRLAFREIHAAGRAGLIERDTLIAAAAAAFRATIPVPQRPSELVAEASIAAAWHIARADAAAGRTRTLPSVAPLLSYVLLAPIVGPGAAASALVPSVGDR
jgi:AcrR family transcriptional regulator